MLKCSPNAIARSVKRKVLYIVLSCCAPIFANAADIPETNICFNNPDNYPDPYIYYWNPVPAGAVAEVGWPGLPMTLIDGFYCRDLGGNVDTMNVIFSNNSFPQTQDLVYPGGGNNCYNNGAWTSLQDCGFNLGGQQANNNFVVFFRNEANYNEPHIHYFDIVPAQPDTQWTGPAMQNLGDGWFSYEFPFPVTSGGAVFNDNGNAQTADVALNPATPCYQNNQFVSLEQCDYQSVVVEPTPTPTPAPTPQFNFPAGNAVFLVNTLGFGTPYAYLWEAIPQGSMADFAWPGVQMTDFGGLNLWYVDVADAVTGGMVIFNENGQNQTADLNYQIATPCYNNGVWMTLEQCGVPAQLTLEAGPNRSANQDSRIALSAAASVGDTTGAVWSSDAWTGDLSGATAVTPVLTTTGTFTVTLSLPSGQTDSFQLTVVAANQALPERPQLAAPLGFPVSGNVSSGNYEFESAFPALDGFFSSPVMVTNDGINDLIYVVDKAGTITVFNNDQGVTQAETTQVLDIRNEVRDFHEQGLLSMEFHPQFAQNGYVYIYYIEGDNDEESSGGRFDDGVLERITLNSTTNPTGIVAGSRVEVLRVPQTGPDHKGGRMQFHPLTGMFYMSFGDGAFGATAIVPNQTDPRTNNSSQELDNLRGTFIRIEMLDNPVNGRYYAIPSDNPFVGQPNVREEIWSYGHRNPWRWSFDTEAPYTLWETEIGQSGFEEVNIIQAGGNYGWPICEGTTHRGNDGGDPGVTRSCTNDLIGPVEGYAHSTGSVSIIGGFVYQGATLSALNGKFLFGDYISRRIWSVEEGQPRELVSDGFPGNISSFGTDLSGENILVSTHGVEFADGFSTIYRVVDRAAEAAVIPPTLSETGLFADLETQFPSSGVIEYDVNSHGWFDGVELRHFVSVPNGETINFANTELWDLPVGSVLVKHVDIPVSASATAPLETSVLFLQTTGWAAANYRWNAAGTEATLVANTEPVTVQQFMNGSIVSVDRTIRTGSDCGSCHVGNGSRDPRGISTRQLNKGFDYQGVSGNQLEVFDSINLFSQGIGAASSYDAFVDPADTSADINERARVYLDTNCESCHSGNLMNVGYDVPLAETAMMNVGVGGGQFRMLPFDHTRSIVLTFQTTDSNRMPRGTSVTNPVAEELFRTWIDGVGANQNGAVVRTDQRLDNIRVGAPVVFDAFSVFDNGFESIPTNGVSWTSSSPAVIDVSSVSGAQITVTPGAEGIANLVATISGFSGSFSVDVLGGPDAPTDVIASTLSSTAISINWTDASNDEDNFTVGRGTSAAGPFTVVATLPANSTSYVDAGLNPSTRYYYEIRANSVDGPSLPGTAFADTQEPGATEGVTIERGSNFTLLTGEARQIAALAQVAGDDVSATLSATWTTNNAAIVDVSASGLVTGGPTAGTATITASVDGVSASVQITNQGPGNYVYFNNSNAGWDEVRIHVFSTSGGVETAHTNFPGDLLEPSVEYGGQWMRYAILAGMQGTQMTEVLFNCGSGACQTPDLIVNFATPWFNDGNGAVLAQEPVGAGAAFAGSQIVLGGGEVTWAGNGSNLSGTLITPGALVDIVANNPGTGQTFARWEGTAAPYLLDPSSPTTTMVVPDILSVTLNAVFDTVTDNFVAARELYRSGEQGCSGCHGFEGQGSTNYPSLANVANDYTFDELVEFIRLNMPPDNPGACDLACATSLAELILAEAYVPPVGVCDASSLDDIVPQDRSYRLLTVEEYNNSVTDLLGLGQTVDVTSNNLPADIPVNGFRTSADTIFTNDYAQGYVNAASEVANLAGNTLNGLVPSCNNDAACTIREFGKRVYRRPLTSAEETDLMAVRNQQGDRAVLITMFSSPNMLYRSEAGELITSGDLIGYYQLTDYEIATLLSYTYWGTTPDSTLLSLADAGQLSTSSQIRTQLADMLSDPRAETAFDRFIIGWLDLSEEVRSTQITDSLRDAMREETFTFVKNIIFGGGNYNELLTADYSYMTQELAQHYNLPWPGGSGVQRVNFSGENSQRRGLLGHASILATQSAQEQTHPVLRGLFVRRNLMCQDFPPPPLGADLDPVLDPTQGVRFRFEQSHQQPGCEACHQFIDGIGFGLENYNALGQFVTTETTANGTVLPIDPNGTIGSINSAETFLSESEPVISYTGLDQLSSIIADSTNSRACFARQWFRYSRGRREAPEDSCTLQSFGQNFRESADGNVLDLMMDYTQTRNFTLRK